jgi:hypothetical protein
MVLVKKGGTFYLAGLSNHIKLDENNLEGG